MSISTRDAALEIAANASLTGYLGFFVGSGFSRAATSGQAPTFRQLMEMLVPRLDLDADILGREEYRFRSFPQVASNLLDAFAKVCQPAEKAGESFRQAIADICNLKPEPAAVAALRPGLREASPSWVITTNYDLILESLFEDAHTVSSDQPLIARPDRVPIYHLHGHRLNPSSIKVTEEDYVGLLGPIDYQRLKLPLLLAESTTLMLGYAFGDINVRAAVSWARSFKAAQGLRLSRGEGLVVQALYVSGTPSISPYEGPNGELVIETSDLALLLQDLAQCRTSLASQLVNVRSAIETFLSDPLVAAQLANHGPERTTFLNILSKALPFSRVTRIIEFLSRGLEPLWDKARADGGFDYYDTYICLLIDALERVTVQSCNPALLSFLADELEKVGSFISETPFAYGTAWKASSTWKAQHKRIHPDMKRELRSYGASHFSPYLLKLLDIADQHP